MRSLMVIGNKYITVESHRDRLAEEKSAALNKVDELKRKLATLEEKSKQDLIQARIEVQNREDKIQDLEEKSRKALEKAKTDAQEREKELASAAAVREEGLEKRLRVLAQALSGKLVFVVGTASLVLPLYLCIRIFLFS